MSSWIDPRYAQAIDLYERSSGSPVVMGNCGNCGGTGRIIYLDPQSQQMKDISCLACSGSGQTE